MICRVQCVCVCVWEGKTPLTERDLGKHTVSPNRIQKHLMGKTRLATNYETNDNKSLKTIYGVESMVLQSSQVRTAWPSS